MEHGVPFDQLHETPRRTEVFSIDFAETLFVQENGDCVCGSCRFVSKIVDRASVCARTGCEAQWQQIVVFVRSPDITEPWLPIYSQSAVTDKSFEHETVDLLHARLSDRVGKIGTQLDVSL